MRTIAEIYRSGSKFLHCGKYFSITGIAGTNAVDGKLYYIGETYNVQLIFPENFKVKVVEE